jgi:hypothetical protein
MAKRGYQFMVDSADLQAGVRKVPLDYKPEQTQQLYATYSVARLNLFAEHRKVIVAHQQMIQDWVTIKLEDVPTLELAEEQETA